MTTLRKAISDIAIDLKAYNLDDKYSYRFIASKLKGNIETFLKQDSLDRTILNINELWKPIYNIALETSYDPSLNIYYDSKDYIKKSIKKIPEVYISKYGNLIKIVNINNTGEYKQIKSFEYKDIKNREFKNKRSKYFWIEDGYLYIPDSDVEEVRGYGLFKDSQEADLFNGTVDCCYKPLDSVLLVPEYIITIGRKEVVTELASINKRLIEDSNPDENQNDK